jgi:hypothetical protein
MSQQFPNDEVDGKQRPIVHVWTAKSDANNGPELVSRATTLLQDVGANLDGFIEGQVFESDDGNAVIVITRWETRHAWADALWNDKVDRLLELVERSAKIDGIVGYPVVTVVPAKN